MALDDDISILARVPTLSLLERDALRLLAFAAQSRILLAGDVIFRQGDPADGGYVVTGGAISLDSSDQNVQPGYVAREGALIGEIALFIETTRPATAIAREPSAVMKLSRDLMIRVLREFPESAIALRGTLESRLAGLSNQLRVVRHSLIAIDAPRT